MVARIDSAAARRRFLCGIAGLCLLPGPAFAAAQAQQTTPTAGDESGSVAAGTNLTRHLTVEVRINGRGPYRFIVDTGAELTVLADTVAAELGLAEGDHVMVEGLTGRIPARRVPVTELVFGPFSHSGLKIPVLPRNFLEADGFLGLDVINGSRVTFDFRRNALHIERPRGRFNAADDGRNAARIQTSGQGGRLWTGNCWIDNVRARAFIDTGAELSVGNLPLAQALHASKRGLPILGPIILTGITGGQIEGQLVPIKSIRMQDLTFSSGSLVIADVPNFDSWQMERTPALLIGMDFLRQFANFSIDYRAREIRFELAEMQTGGPVHMARA